MASQARVSWPGVVGGIALAPLTAFGSYVRRARVFHPSGVCLRGTASPVGGDAGLGEAGMRLSGPVLARFSGGWWKSHQWPDVLGCALRFTADEALDPAPRGGDQDLLLATIRTPLTTLLAPLSTHVGDYLGNAYFGVSPFQVAPLGRVKLRLSPVGGSPPARGREQRLLHALEHGPIRLMLEARANRLGSRYRPLASIELVERIDVDQRALRFDPFINGRGFEPVGFVHALRVASYAASRRARDAVAAPRG